MVSILIYAANHRDTKQAPSHAYWNTIYQPGHYLFCLFTSFIILEPDDITSAGVTVTCKSQYMDVALNRLVYPWLVPGTLHMNLIQSNCTAYNVTDMQIRIQAPIYGCGTNTLRKNKFVLESRNVFITREKRPPGFRITYLPDMHFPFICRYEITHSAGKTVLKQLGK